MRGVFNLKIFQKKKKLKKKKKKKSKKMSSPSNDIDDTKKSYSPTLLQTPYNPNKNNVKHSPNTLKLSRSISKGKKFSTIGEDIELYTTRSINKQQHIKTPKNYTFSKNKQHKKVIDNIDYNEDINYISDIDLLYINELRWLRRRTNINDITNQQYINSFINIIDKALDKITQINYSFIKKASLLICDKIIVRILNLLGYTESLYNEWERCEQSKSIFGLLPLYFIEQSPIYWQKLLSNTKNYSIDYIIEAEIEKKLTILKEIEINISSSAGKLYHSVLMIKSSTTIQQLHNNILKLFTYLKTCIHTNNHQLNPNKPMKSTINNDTTDLQYILLDSTTTTSSSSSSADSKMSIIIIKIILITLIMN